MAPCAADTYGYHGDDGRAYHNSGFGRRFHGPFGVGQTVGTGLVFRRGAGAKGLIFYTVDGELVGAPFEQVVKPQLLQPTIGLHSPRERIAPNLGGRAGQLLAAAPPAPPAPFQFDLNAAIARGSLPGIGDAPPAVTRGDPPRGDPQVAEELAALIAAAAGDHGAGEEGEEGGAEGEEGEEGEEGADGHDDGGASTDGEEDAEAVHIAEVAEIFALVTSHAESDEALAEMRFYVRSRLGPQADALHVSWGAPNVDQLEADRLRHLCFLLLQQE